MEKGILKQALHNVSVNGTRPTYKPEQIGVFIIDSHAIVRAGLRLLFEDIPGIIPKGEAANGHEALNILQEAHPQIILFEYLGKESDVDLLPKLREVAPQSHIIILTGCHETRKHHQAIILGARGLVLKDQDTSVLVKAIRRVHAGELWIERTLMYEVMGKMAQQKSSDPDAAKIATLTAREIEIITQIGEGLKNKQIAERLFISETTVRHHLTSIFGKLDVADRLELVIYAYRHDLCRISR